MKTALVGKKKQAALIKRAKRKKRGKR